MSWPYWLEPLLDAESMRATDAWAIQTKGVPSLELMERAGEGLAELTAEVAPAGRVAIVCGKGNNGGDGLVVARLLREREREVDVHLLWSAQWLSTDARHQLQRLPGPAPFELDPGALKKARVIVDAILGTGSEGAPRDAVAAGIRAIEAAGRHVVAADIPSGVNASTGAVEGVVVHATATGAFHRGKPGLWVWPGKACAGEVRVLDIGIRRAPGEPRAGLIERSVLREVPHRGAASTKFTSGNVFVIGGSRGLSGAPCLAALAAARAGAGYVTVAAPGSIEAALSVRLLEAMVRPMPEENGALGPEALEPVIAAIRRADAVVLGPGLGREPGAQSLARELVSRIDVPLVIDADGLNALVGHVDDLKQRPWPTVLTPHAGELGRLLDIESDAVQADRLGRAREAARRTGALVVLKGDDTLVAAPGGRVAISRGGAPALASAGTGDVLSGVIAALLARRMATAHAACAAVYAHTRAGQLAAEPHGPDGVIASDVIAALPAAFNA